MRGDSMKARWRRGFWALLLAAVIPVSVSAQNGGSKTLEEWSSRLDECRALVASGEWKKARRLAETLLGQMTRKSRPEDEMVDLLAGTVAMRGIAEAGLGNERDARWDWSVAGSLSPGSIVGDLGATGDVGAILAAPETAPAPRVDTRPEVRRGEYPPYPRTRKASCLESAVVVEAVVNREGLLEAPRLENGADVVLSFAAMDALRHWEFVPAQLNGEAVPAVYSIWIMYDLPLCEAP